MAILRIFGVAVALAGTGLTLARNKLDNTIEKKIAAKIQEAKEDAILDLDQAVTDKIQENFIFFARNLAFKAIVIGFIASLKPLGLYTGEAMALSVAVMLGLFLFRDLWVMAPTASYAFKLLRDANWNLLQGIRNLVAANVFERAYEQVMNETRDSKVKYWIALSRYSPEDISNQIANAISEVAANASISIVRTRIGIALSKAAMMMIAYSFTLWWALTYF